MGGIFSRQGKTDPDDYEKILSELDENIQKAEIRLSEIKLRERRTGVLWILYTALLWAAFLIYSFITLHGAEEAYDWDVLLVTVVPVLVIPLFIYYTRRLLKWFYVRKQTNEESNLAALRAQQKLKVEELKKKTSYYSTKSLLERYDLTAAKQKQQQRQSKQQQAARPTSMPLPRPRSGPEQMNGNGPNPQHPDQTLRQRTSGQVMPNEVRPQQRPQQPMMIQPPPPPRERQWYDKLIDALVGDEGPETKYALICRYCYAHNGLIQPQEIDFIQYTCPHCRQFNPALKQRETSESQSQSHSPKATATAAGILSPSSSSGHDENKETKKHDEHASEKHGPERTILPGEEEYQG